MNKKLLLSIAAVSLSVLALSGCSQGSPSTGGSTSSPSETASETPAADAALSTSESSLGDIVVDGAGMTVYIFDKDTADSGTSVCEGDCLAKWPAVVATSDTPAVDGVTGKVGVITRTDGTKQVTLNGLPLYYYAGDTTAGDTTGQAVGDVWWVVAPSGEKIGASAG